MNNFETFCEAVKDLWPRYKTTPRQLQVHWNNFVCYHKPGVVSAALTKAVSEFPNDIAPEWNIIRGYLAGRSERDGVAKSEFELLLNRSRKACKGDAVPTSGNLSDEDAWLRWLRVLTQSISQSDATGPCQLCERSGKVNCGLSERECRTRYVKRNETSYWRQLLVDRAETVPVFLLDGYERVGEFVEPKEPKATLF